MVAPNPTGKGGFVKGISGNPSGRSKENELRALCRERTKEAFDAVHALLNSKREDIRIKAANLLFQYGWGLPRLELDVTTAGQPTAIFSDKPLTAEQFALKYAKKEEDIEDGVIVGEVKHE